MRRERESDKMHVPCPESERFINGREESDGRGEEENAGSDAREG